MGTRSDAASARCRLPAMRSLLLSALIAAAAAADYAPPAVAAAALAPPPAFAPAGPAAGVRARLALLGAPQEFPVERADERTIALRSPATALALPWPAIKPADLADLAAACAA